MGQRLEDENGVIDVVDDGIPGGRAPASCFEDENGNFTCAGGDTGGSGSGTRTRYIAFNMCWASLMVLSCLLQ